MTVSTSTGKAYLVGAGPGRPDLITVRGLSLLRKADVVVYDRLVAPELLTEAPPDAELIDAGKSPGSHRLPQEKINQILIDKVSAGNQVVRLKGGDPFVFGRGGEEALALQSAGLDFEIVPGITSAIAVPAYAGIPVTHRGMATGFVVITGHEAADKEDQLVDWCTYTAIPTLVLMMAFKNLAEITGKLIDAGRDPHTPAAIIYRGTTAAQKTLVSTLDRIAVDAVSHGFTHPSIVIVGEVVGLANCISWFENEMVSACPEIP